MIHNYIQNKTSFILPFVAIIGLLLFSSCDDDNSSGPEVPEPEVEANTVEDLDASSDGVYTFFSLRTGEIVDRADSASTEWDLAFNGTNVLTNGGVSGPGEGGALILDVSFDGVSMAPSEGYSVDSEEVLAIPTGSNNGWYTYTLNNEPQHAILPLPEKTIVVKTADGNHYAKIEMISYYKGNPDTSTEEFADYANRRVENKFYTFRYVIQLEEGVRELE